MLPDSLVIAAGRLGSLRKNGGAESAARLILSRISAPSPSPRDVLQSVIVLEAEGLLSFTKPSHHEITDRILRGGAFPESGRIPVDWKNPVEALRVIELAIVQAQSIAESFEAKGGFCVNIFSDSYPGKLRLMEKQRFSKSGKELSPEHDAPDVLFCMGERSLIVKSMLGITGSAYPSEEGRVSSYYIGRAAGRAGVPVLSLLSRGSPEAALAGALDAGGRGIAVLGSGLSSVPHGAMHDLAERILESGGLLVSEYLPGTSFAAFQLTAENRIIGTLPSALVITETPSGGEPFHAARRCAAAGVRLYAVSFRGEALRSRPVSAGNLELIRDMGASPLTSGTLPDLISFCRR